MNLPRSVSAPIIVFALVCATLVGCSPTPAPTPTPTPAFASEEEAFAVAEETYRDYIDAFNDVDLGIPKTFEPLFTLTSGDFEASDRETLSELHAQNYRYIGEMALASFSGIESSPSLRQVEAEACIDVRASDVLDQSGRSVVNADRPDINPLRVTFKFSEGSMLIDRAERDQEISCGSD